MSKAFYYDAVKIIKKLIKQYYLHCFSEFIFSFFCTCMYYILRYIVLIKYYWYFEGIKWSSHTNLFIKKAIVYIIQQLFC